MPTWKLCRGIDCTSLSLPTQNSLQSKMLPPDLLALFFSLAALSPCAAAANDARPPITLSSTGGFSVGGRTIHSPSNPNLTLTCDWGYMEYFIPARPRRTSIVMWHSATTQAFQNNWAGGEGFKDIFLRLGYPVYLWDGPRVGRANWACEPTAYVPEYRDQANFAGWNFGPSFMDWWPGVQFPVGDAEAWKAATRTRYVEYDSPENFEVESDAAVAAADGGRLGDSVVYMTNSASGLRALLTASKSVSGSIRGIIAYEPIGLLFPDDVEEVPDEGNPALGPFAPYLIPAEQFYQIAKLDVVQMVWGDHRDPSFWWYNHSMIVADLLNEAGGNAEFLRLAEDAGLEGSTHSPFADLNNHAVAGLVEDLFARYGLDEYVDKRRWFGL